MDDSPNAFSSQNFGYTTINENTVHYLSARGETKVCVDVYRLNKDENDNSEFIEQRHRVKVECEENWVTVNSVSMSSGNWRTELTLGLADGTIIAVTRQLDDDIKDDNIFNITARTVDGQILDTSWMLFMWADNRPMLEQFDDGVIQVNMVDDTKILANFCIFNKYLCEVHVSDGSKIRTCAEPTAVQPCDDSDLVPDEAYDFDHDHDTGNNCIYLVCRRDLSGYEFVNGMDALNQLSATMVNNPRINHDNFKWLEKLTPLSPADRILTPSRFDDRTFGLLDKALSVHFKSIKTLADQLNSDFLENLKVEPKILTTKTDAEILDERIVKV